MIRTKLYSIVTISMLTMLASFTTVAVPPVREVIIANPDTNPVQVEIPTMVQVSVGTTYRFHRLSNQDVSPDGGINRINRVCREEFGNFARMCTSEEFDLSISDVREESQAWIKPSIVTAFYDTERKTPVTYDYSGFTWDGESHGADCGGWQISDPRFTGLVLHTGIDGYARELSRCDVTRRVVCCLPQ